jgi:hypothetical protein
MDFNIKYETTFANYFLNKLNFNPISKKTRKKYVSYICSN